MPAIILMRPVRGGIGATARVCASVLALTLLPLQPATGNPPGGDAAERLRKGSDLLETRALYRERCAECHGERGHGTPGAPKDFSAPQALVDLTPARFRTALAERHDGRLSAPLGAEERRRIIDYVRSYLMLPAPDADTAKGRAIYAESCSVCHGDRGNAASWAKNSLDPAPADFTTHSLAELSRAEMIDAVTFGAQGTAMMPFAVQLTRAEIAATVDYIRTAFMTEESGGGPAGADHDHDAAHDHGRDEGDDGSDHARAEHHGAEGAGVFPGGLVGNPVWGGAFYDANCAECHGKDGDGEGPRAYFMLTKPENFLSREARAELTREELFEYISEGVTGTTMPAWEEVLTPQQIANVGEYVYRAFLHPEAFAATVPEEPEWRPAGNPERQGAKKTDMRAE